MRGSPNSLKKTVIAADVLPVLAVAFLALCLLAVMVVYRGDIRVERAGLEYRGRFLDELDLHHLSGHIANDLKVGNAVGFPRLDDVLKYLFGVLLDVQQLNDLLRPAELRRHLRRFLRVLDIPYAYPKPCDIVLVGPDTLGENGAVLYQIAQAPQVAWR